MNDVSSILSSSAPRKSGKTATINTTSSTTNSSSLHLLVAFCTQSLMVTIISILAIVYFNTDTRLNPANHNAKEITEFIL